MAEGWPGRAARRCCGDGCAPSAGVLRTLPLLASFWVMGLLNNSAYVICLALATEISSGGVGLVYLASILPTVLVKATVPLWYHAVSAPVRMAAVGGLMALAYCLIALGRTLGAQLAGVAVVALQGGLGEATVLALCARYPPTAAALTAWSSGTGAAGVFGYLWVAALRVWLRLPFAATLLLANGLAAAWLAAYFLGLRRLAGGGCNVGTGGSDGVVGRSPAARGARGVAPGELCTGGAGAAGGDAGERAGLLADQRAGDGGGSGDNNVDAGAVPAGARSSVDGPGACGSQPGGQREGESGPRQVPPALGSPCTLSIESADMEAGTAERPSKGGPGGGTGSKAGGGSRGGGGGRGCGGVGGDVGVRGRFREVMSLWPYTVPLFVVYAAEYTMQSGAWSAMGFPVESEQARHKFYLYSNWLYQAAVFISRSSGTLLPVGRRGLWAMPALQCALLAWFVADAALHLWDNWGVLVLCFAAGLLGGATYVNAFTLLSREVPPHRREFGLAAACVADSLGIAVADAGAVFLQGCLLRANGLAAVAVYKCGA